MSTRPGQILPLVAVHGQAALLLRYDVPTYYVSQELLAAALRTELPDDMVLEAIPFHSMPWFLCCRKGLAVLSM